jgi:steroid delta-isomerase-like uncharacterized protein
MVDRFLEEKRIMSVEANKALVRRFWEQVWNQGDLLAIDEMVAPEFVKYVPGRPMRGIQALKDWIAMSRTGAPDLRFTIEQEVAEGDAVATRWSARGTHSGPLLGIPATGKVVTMSGINIFRIANGKITEDRTAEDTLGLLQQLGVIPPMGPPPGK